MKNIKEGDKLRCIKDYHSKYGIIWTSLYRDKDGWSTYISSINWLNDGKIRPHVGGNFGDVFAFSEEELYEYFITEYQLKKLERKNKLEKLESIK